MRGSVVCKCLFFFFCLQLLFANEPHQLITSKTLQDHCDYYYDAWHRTNINPYALKKNCTIFVSNETLPKFFADIHPRIRAKYILVSHGGDYCYPGQYKSLANDPRIIVWFTMNIDRSHPKVKPLPIGFSPYAHCSIDEVSDHLNRVQKENLPKKHLLYLSFLNFMVSRQPVYEHFSMVPFCHNPGMLNFANYAETLASSKFVLAPSGTGPESHRLWEALYCGSYPIVLSSPLDPLYEDLPVVIVKEWSEITEELLNQKYEEMKSKKYSMEKVTLQYWLDLIDSYKLKKP